MTRNLWILDSTEAMFDNTRKPIPLVKEGIEGFKYPTTVFCSIFLYVNKDQVVTRTNHFQGINGAKNKDGPIPIN